MAEVSSSSGTHSPSLRLREGLYERHFSKNQLTKAKTSLRKVALTTTYYWTFICYGMAIALIGPTIPVLSDSTSTPISRMGWIFTMKGIGVILGSLVGSKAFDSIYSRSHRLANFLLVAAIGLSTASLGLIPIVNNFTSMLFLYLAFGFCAGLINMGCNLLLMYSWESYVPGLIIGLTAAAGIGSTISPLLIASGLQFNSVYRLVSGLFVSSAVLLTLCQMIPSKTKYAPLEDEEITEDNEELIETDQDIFVQQRPRFSQKLKNFMLGTIVGLSLFGAVAIESSFGGLLSTFLREKGLAGTYKVNALMNSTFWLSMTFGRLLSLSASRWIGSSVLLSLSANGVFASLAILLAAPRSEIAWLGIALMGLSLSGMYPLALGYPETSMKGVNFTPAMSSAMLLMASSAELVVPAFITTTIGKVGPNALIWTLIGATGITFVSYIGMFLWSTVLKYSSSRLSRDQIPLMQADSLFESPNSPVPLSPASDFIEEKDPQHVEKPATPA